MSHSARLCPSQCILPWDRTHTLWWKSYHVPVHLLSEKIEALENKGEQSELEKKNGRRSKDHCDLTPVCLSSFICQHPEPQAHWTPHRSSHLLAVPLLGMSSLPSFHVSNLFSLLPEIESPFTLCIRTEVTLCVHPTKTKPSYMWFSSFFGSLPPRVHSLGTLTHILTLVFRLIPSTWDLLAKAHQLMENIWNNFVSSNTASFLQNQITKKTQIECSWDRLGW